MRVSCLEYQEWKRRTNPNSARLLVDMVSLIQLVSYFGEIDLDFFWSPWFWFTELGRVSDLLGTRFYR